MRKLIDKKIRRLIFRLTWDPISKDDAIADLEEISSLLTKNSVKLWTASEKIEPLDQYDYEGSLVGTINKLVQKVNKI